MPPAIAAGASVSRWGHLPPHSLPHAARSNCYENATDNSNDFEVLAVLERLDSHDDLNSTGGGPRTQIGDMREAVSGLDFNA